MIGDAAASLGVILAGFLMLRFQWYLADPLISVAISLVIVWGAYRIVRETVHILMEGTPRGLHMEEIVRALERLPGVKSVHDLHAWNISYNIPSVSMHIIVDPCYPDYQEVLDRCNRVLAIAGGKRKALTFSLPVCGASTPEGLRRFPIKV